MKALLLLVLLSTCQAFATDAPNSYMPVDKAAKATYMEAIQSALAGHELGVCTKGGSFSLAASLAQLPKSEELFMNRAAQPVFIFRFRISAFDYYDYVFEVSQDRKTVTKFGYKTYKMGRVNKGDLYDPVMVDDLIIDDQASCEIR